MYSIDRDELDHILSLDRSNGENNPDLVYPTFVFVANNGLDR
jgi:hypothetical protein